MIRVAAGEPLAFTQAQIAAQRLGDRVPDQRRGSAARLPAEHRPAGRVPAAGADALSPALPRARRARGIRVDTGVYEGGEIPIHYDSMICKLIASAPTAPTRSRRMRDALDALRRSAASRATSPFQSALLAHPRFAAGDFDTGFIAEEFPQGFTARLGRIADPTSCSRSRWPPTAACWRARPASAASCPATSCRSASDFVVVADRRRRHAHTRRRRGAGRRRRATS